MNNDPSCSARKAKNGKERMRAMGLLDPTSREPLFPLILEGIQGDCGEADPSAYLRCDGNDGNSSRADDGDAASRFWIEAHALSCLKRASFLSSVEFAYDDAMPASFDGHRGDSGRASHLDSVGRVIGRDGVCARIEDDGAVSNGDAGGGGRYATAFFVRTANDANDPFGLTSASDQQIETAARLSGLLLMGPFKQHGHATKKKATASHSDSDQTVSAAGGWFQYPTSFARKITNGVSYAIDRALTVYEGDEDCSGLVENLDRKACGVDLDDASSSMKLLLGKDVGSTMKIPLSENDEDDAVARRKGVATTTVGEDDSIGNADEVISIAVVASACRHLLAFSKQQQEGRGEDGETFFPGLHHGGVERVMLYRHGWDTCSFGSFCRQAGIHFASDQHGATAATYDGEKSIRLGKILSDISERGADLLAGTLCKSNYALLEKNTITLFPGGTPCDFAPCPSERALFQIHVAKIAIRGRMSRLERDAGVAGRIAVEARRNGGTRSAMAHMRRRRALTEESDRCASVLENLDSGELRLERARTDAQVVRSYSLLRTALRDMHKSDDTSYENVEDLMSDIREEMEDDNRIGAEAISLEVVIDEDELNKEFKLLEMESGNEQCSVSNANNDKIREKTPNKVAVQPVAEQQEEESCASNVEAVAA